MRLLLILIVTLAGPASAAAQTTIPGDSLWDKAAAVAEADNPFDPAVQGRVTARRRARSQTIEGMKYPSLYKYAGIS